MALFLPQRWRQQPLGPVSLDRANSLTQGISFCYLPGQNFPELVSGRRPSDTLVTRGVGPNGPQASWADNGSSAFPSVYGVPGGDVTRASGFSIFAIAAPVSQAERDTLLFMGDESGGAFTQSAVVFNIDTATTVSAGLFTYIEYSGGFKQRFQSAAGVVDGKWHTWCVESCSNVSWDLFRDAVSVAGTGALSTGVAVPVGTYVGNTSLLTNNRGLEYPVALVAIFPYLLGSSRRRALQENPWQLFAPLPARRYFFGAAAGAAQYMRPSSDISTGTWRPSSGATLAPMLSESTPDDANYIFAQIGTTAEIKLGAVTDPAVSSGHTLRYRAASRFSRTLTMGVYNGASLVASFPQVLTPTLTQYEVTLSGAEADAITDYTDVRVKPTGSA